MDCIATLWGAPDTDPCSNERSIVHAPLRYQLPQDGLSLPWLGRVYCNPPYSDPGPWVEKCMAHAQASGDGVIACVIADPSTRWWRKAIWRPSEPLASAVCFPDHRIRFLPPPGANVSSMSRPVALPYWGPDAPGFARAFSPLGKVVLL